MAIMVGGFATSHQACSPQTWGSCARSRRISQGICLRPALISAPCSLVIAKLMRRVPTAARPGREDRSGGPDVKCDAAARCALEGGLPP